MRFLILLAALAITPSARADVSDSGNLAIGGNGVITGTMTVQANVNSGLLADSIVQDGSGSLMTTPAVTVSSGGVAIFITSGAPNSGINDGSQVNINLLDDATIAMLSYNAGVGPELSFWAAEGTADAIQATLQYDFLTSIYTKGYDGTNPQVVTPSSGQLHFYAEENFAVNYKPASFNIVTNGYGTGNSTRHTHLVVTSTGPVVLGSFSTEPVEIGPTAQLDVRPQSGYDAINAAGNVIAQGDITDGNVTSCATALQTDSGGKIICSVSDSKLKTNVQVPAYNSGLIDSLTPRTFSYADGKRAPGTHYGFVAEEVQSAFPDAAVPAGYEVTPSTYTIKHSRTYYDKEMHKTVTETWETQAPPTVGAAVVGVDPLAVIAALTQEVQALRKRVAALEAK
jgi:hypothetical protein